MVFTPTLVKRSPAPRAWILGDLTSDDVVRDLLTMCGVARRERSSDGEGRSHLPRHVRVRRRRRLVREGHRRTQAPRPLRHLRRGVRAGRRAGAGQRDRTGFGRLVVLDAAGWPVTEQTYGTIPETRRPPADEIL